MSYSPFTDRFGSRRVLIYGLIAMALATAAVAAASTLMLLLIARVAQGFAAAACTPRRAVLYRLAPPARRTGRIQFRLILSQFGVVGVIAELMTPATRKSS